MKVARRRQMRRPRGLVRAADAAHDRGPERAPHARRVLRPDRDAARLSRSARGTRRSQLVDRTSPYALTGAVFARDRARDRRGDDRAARRRRQLLHQRQADRRGRRPAAVRRRARVGHRRQGRLAAEPPALGRRAHDQGDVRAADRLPLPVPRRSRETKLSAPWFVDRGRVHRSSTTHRHRLERCAAVVRRRAGRPASDPARLVAAPARHRRLSDAACATTDRAA